MLSLLSRQTGISAHLRRRTQNETLNQLSFTFFNKSLLFLLGITSNFIVSIG